MCSHQPGATVRIMVGIRWPNLRATGRAHTARTMVGEDSPAECCVRGLWWAQLGSNQRPLACKASALPLSYAPGAIDVVRLGQVSVANGTSSAGLQHSAAAAGVSGQRRPAALA